MGPLTINLVLKQARTSIHASAVPFLQAMAGKHPATARTDALDRGRSIFQKLYIALDKGFNDMFPFFTDLPLMQLSPSPAFSPTLRQFTDSPCIG